MKKEASEEKPETKEQRAQDVVYTVNHAIACTVTDIGSPFIGNWTQQYLGRRFEPGCGHDHSHDGHDHAAHDHAGHEHHDHAAPLPGGHLGHWWIGEAVGDFGAVPVTIALVRHAPRFMDGLRKVSEPVLGPLFRMGARRGARQWAKDNNVTENSAATKTKEDEIYHYEIRHLPQALVWTATSTVLNVATQRAVGNKGPLWHIAAGKLSGAAFSTAIVVGGRTVAPAQAQQWESTVSRKVVLPASKVASRAFGVDTDTVERVSKEQVACKGNCWEKRVEKRDAASPQMAAAPR